MFACPNKSSKEWKSLADKIGEDAAMLAFIRNNEQVPTSVDTARELITNVGLLKSLESVQKISESTIFDSLIHQGIVLNSSQMIDGKKHYNINMNLPDIGKRLGAITDKFGAILEYKDDYVRVNPDAVAFWNNIAEQNNETKATAVQVARSFLSRIGVGIKQQNDVLKQWGSNGVANFAERMVYIQSGKMDEALPEEALHFFLDMIPQDTPELIEALDKIRDTSTYKSTLEKYKNNPNYRTKDGNIRFDKIKKEALAKHIAEQMKSKDEKSIFKRLLDKLISWIKGIKMQRTAFDTLEEMFRNNEMTNIDMLLDSTEVYNQLSDEDKAFYESQEMSEAQKKTVSDIIKLSSYITFEKDEHKLEYVDPVTGKKTTLKSTTKILGSDFYSELESDEAVAKIVNNFALEFPSVYDNTDDKKTISKKLVDHVVKKILEGEYSDKKKVIDILGAPIAELLFASAENRKKTLFGTAIHNIVEAVILDKTIDFDNPDMVDPMIYNFMDKPTLRDLIYGTARRPGIVSVVQDLVKSGHVLMTEVQVGNASLGGIIDIIAIDKNGVAHILDFKTKFLRDQPEFKKFATLEEEFDYVTSILSKGGIKADEDVLPKLVGIRRALKTKYSQQLSIYKKLLMQAGIAVGEITIVGVPYKLDADGKVIKIKPVMTTPLPFNKDIASGYFPDLDESLDASQQNKKSTPKEDDRIKLLDSISKPTLKESFVKMKARLDQVYLYFKKNKDARFVYDMLNTSEGTNRVEDMNRLIKNFLEYYGEEGDVTNMLALQKGVLEIIDSSGEIIKIINTHYEAIKSSKPATQEAAVQQIKELMRVREFLIGYQNMFQEMLSYMGTTDMENPVVAKLNNMVGAISNITNDYINTISPYVASALGGEFTKELLNNMTREYNELIQAARQRGDIKRAEQLEKERDELPSEKVIAELLKGEMGDAGWFFSKFLPAISNPDIIIAAVAKRLKRVLDGVRLQMKDFRDGYGIQFNKRIKIYGRGVRLTMKDINESLVYEVKRFRRDGKESHELVLKSEFDEKLYYDHDVLKNNLENELENLKKVTEENDAAKILEAKSKVSKAKAELKSFELKYFESDFTKEYYDMTKMLDISVTYGGSKQTIREIINNIFKEIRFIESKYDVESLAAGKMKDEDVKQRQELWESYYDLMELKNEDGTDKTGDARKIAESLQEYQKNKRKIFQDVEMKETFEKLKAKKKLEFGEDSEEYKTWLANNTRMIIKDSYYEKIEALTKELALLSSNPNSEKITELYQELRTITQPYKDKDGFINGGYIKEEDVERIKNIESEIERLRDEVDEYTPDGYTREEKAAKRALKWTKYNDNINFSEKDQFQLDKIENDRKIRLATDKELADKVKRGIEIKKELGAMRNMELTKYYYDELLSREEDFAKLKGVSHDQLTTDDRLYEEFRETEWYKKNHNIEEVSMFDSELGATIKSRRVTPIYIWKRNVPIPEYIEEKPARHFYRRVLNDSFENEAGETIKLKNTDNRDILNRYKPKSNEQFRKEYGKDHDYLNQDYVRLRDRVNSGTATEKEKVDYENLIYLTNVMLNAQQDIEMKYRLGLAIPFREKTASERTFETGGKNVKGKVEEAKDKVASVIRGVKRSLTKTEASGSEGFLDSEESKAPPSDMSKLATIDNDEVKYVPVKYTSKGEASDNSYDVWGSILNYVGSTIRKKELDKELALINGLEEILTQKENQPKGEAKNKIVDNVMSKYLPGVTKRLNLGTNTRLEVLKSFINTVLYNEDHFEGYDVLGVNTQKIVDKMMSLSSFTFLGLAPFNWAVNWLSGQVQNMVEAAGGRYYNFKDYGSAKKDIYGSGKYGNPIKDMMSDYSKVGGKSFWGQIMEVFDPIQGETENEFGEKTSWNKFGNIFRAGIFAGKIWGEWEIQMSSFIAFMKNVKLYNGQMYDKESFITMKVGTEFVGMTTEQIREKKLEALAEFNKIKTNLIDILHLENGKLAVKPEYAGAFEIGGRQFSDLVAKLHSMQKRINGSYAKFDTAYAAKSSLGRMMFFFRKYFIQLGMNRLGYRRADYEGMTVEQGFYITFAQTFLKDLARFRFKSALMWNNYSDSERAAIRKTLTDLAVIAACFIMYNMILGFDSDDDDRIKKLKEESWGKQASIYLLLKVKSETEQFIPWPSLGLAEIQRIYSSPSILLPTVSNFIQMFGQIFLHTLELTGMDFPSLYYQKKSGESPFKEKGDPKLIANIMKTFFGYTGKTIHPIDAIKGFEYSQRVR